MKPLELEIIYEDNHLLVVNKPPGLPTMGVSAGVDSLAQRAKQYIKESCAKPGNVYLGIMSRLDAPTSGVVLFARTSKAAARLTEQFRTHTAQKTYWGLLSGAVEPASGTWIDWLAKDEARQRMVVLPRGRPGAKRAELHYRLLRSLRGGSLVEIDLRTGRKHQIRVQAASRALSVWGEQKYGRGLPFGAGIALHARRLVVDHPVRHEPVELVAALPPAWGFLRIGESQ